MALTKKPEKNQLVGYLDELYDKGNQARWMFMAQWLQNYFFYVGNQYMRWVGNGIQGKWEVIPELDGRIQYTSNKILPATRMSVGRMIKDNMQQVVIHANNDEESIDAAKAASRFLDYLWRQTDGDRIRKEVCTWAVLTGIGVTKTYIDYNKGPQRKSSKQKDGDICIDVLSPFEFVVPPNARYMEKLPWAMHARMETREYVFEKWGIDVEASAGGGTWAMYQAVNLDIMGDGAYFGAGIQFDSDTVLVKELWIRPCKNWPNGRVIIVAGDTLVHDEDIPFDKNYWPFNWMPYGDVPFRFWPMSMVESMVDPQKAINRMGSTILENIRYMGNPVLLAPQGSVDADTMVAEPGAVWEFNEQMGKPEFAAPVPVSPEIFSEKSALESEIYDLAGIHMLGSGMSGLRAAAAIMLVEQQDETAFAPVIGNVQAWMRRDADLKLFLAQKAFSTPRKVKVLGEEGQWEIQEFNAAELSGDEDIDIQTKQEFANDKVTKFNQVGQLLAWKDENGQPLADRHTALQLLDMAGLDGATSEYDLDVNRAKWENQQLRANKDVSVNDYDDHAVHIKIHNQDRKRIDFESLPKHVQDAYAMHVQSHQQMLQEQSPMQTAAKGDEQVGGGSGPQAQMPGPQGMAPPPALGNVGGFNGANALQSGLSQTQNLIAKGQT